jgi:hypothetical protein
MQLTRPKVIALTLLAVLVALGSASLFAQNGSSATAATTLQLTPTSGCPGDSIIVELIFPDGNGDPAITAPELGGLTSYPDGLISSFNGRFFIVGDSVCAGDYVVTAKLAIDEQGVGNGDFQTFVEASTHFTVGGQGCPGLPACRPVGGVVMPTNTLAITAPYLALAGLVAVVSAVVAVKRRRD